MNEYLAKVTDLLRELGDDPLAVNAMREEMIRTYSSAIPDDAALDLLAEQAPLVELGAGGGYWAALLRSRGVQIDAFDLEPGGNEWFNRSWTDVRVGDTDVLERHPAPTLLLVWPAHETRLGSRALAAFRGTTLAYIGEPGGDVDPDFDRMLEAHWRTRLEVRIPAWPTHADTLAIMERR